MIGFYRPGTWPFLPAPAFTTAGWSARFTGEINLAGVSNLSVSTGEGTATVWVDDTTADSSRSNSAGRHRITVEIAGVTSKVALRSRPAGTGSFADVAGNTLIPATTFPPAR